MKTLALLNLQSDYCPYRSPSVQFFPFYEGTPTLTWNDSDANVCSFIVKRSTTSGGPYSSIGTTAANVKTFVDSGLQTGTYCYRVVAHNDSGDSPDSDEICKDISACLPPAAPSNLNAVNVNGTQVNLTWTDNSSDETSFVLERMDVTNYQPFSEIARPAANATSYSDTNVTPLYHYKYRIKAIRTSGGIECPSAWVESPEVTLTPSDWALRTDGFDDYAATTAAGATSGLNVTGNITVEAWVVLYDTNVTDMIVSKHRTSVAEGGYQLFVTNTNQLSFVTYTAAGAVAASIVSTQTLQTKQWYHVVGSYLNSSGGKIGVAVNGQITSATVGLNKGAATSSSHVQLGRVLTSAGTGSKYLRGKIDEVRISNIVRYSVNFDPNLYKNLTSDANTKALWKMNNGTGTSATDSSSNAYTATLYNGVLWKAGVTTNYIDKQPHARHGASGSESDNPDGTSPGIGEGSAEAGKIATGTANWNLDYDYDQWGNMWMKNSSTQNWLPYKNIVIQTNYRKNQVATVDGNVCLYDDAGNLYRETVNGNQQDYSYDAENRMWKAVISGMNGGTVTYVYDGDGRRVKKRILNGTTTKYIYNSSGQLVAEFEGTTRTKEYVYGPTGMLAAVQTPGASETIEYTTADHLGTPRVITQPNGTVLSRHDYVPFGTEIPTTFGRTGSGYQGTDDVRHKFTSKERDTETNLDYFGARYYGSPQGRFTSPDEPLVDQWEDEPQSWNLYCYGRNNPLLFVDPTGRFTVWYVNGKRIGDETTVTINNEDGTLTTADGTVYQLDALEAQQEVRDAGGIGPPLSDDEIARGAWYIATGREDGSVRDPSQMPISRWIFGEDRVDYRSINPADLPPLSQIVPFSNGKPNYTPGFEPGVPEAGPAVGLGRKAANQVANAAVRKISREVGLSRVQHEMLHRWISKQGFSLEEIRELAEEIKRYFPNK